jgi:ketosteroid isomerase-like protein
MRRSSTFRERLGGPLYSTSVMTTSGISRTVSRRVFPRYCVARIAGATRSRDTDDVSQENVELVRRAYQAFNERDLDALMEMHAKDVDWRLIGGFADFVGPNLRGRAEVRRWFNEWIENLGSGLEIERILEANDRLVVIARAIAAGGTSGAPASLRFGQLYTFRDGQISSVESYYGVTEALEAAGLQE